ncbi:MAG TPA: lysophospholipid acyltransferase family protein [Gemmatimonadaceae bacterium]
MSDRAPAKVRWGARIGAWVIRALATTWRLRIVHGERLREHRRSAPVILALWHGDMLPPLWQHRGERVAILISEHGDGEIIARIGLQLGHAAVRGSTSRGAARALLALSRTLEEGRDVAITPDGPRGPAGQFAPGALAAAQRSGAAIVAIGVHAPRAWRLRSWDRFLIPKPFSRVTIAYGPPTTVEAPSVREAASEAPRFQALMEAARDEARRVHEARAPGGSR